MKEFTSDELSICNGKDGSPVYIAFEGKVYDVSKSPLWSKGMHMQRHAAGQDNTGALSAAPHGTEVFERYPQMGILKKGIPEELKHLPAFLQNLLQRFPMLRRHPHPMLVHFPIAFLMASSLFLLISFFFQDQSFRVTSFYLLILGGISSPFAMASGLLTWWVNYRLKLTSFVRRKLQLSILLLLLEIILISWGLIPWWSSRSGVTLPLIHPFYLILVLLLTPMVVLLGYYGGQMTFPPEKI